MSTATEEPLAPAPTTTDRELTYLKAFNEGLAQSMRNDENVVVIGEDVAEYGGVFHNFEGLHEEFGPRRMVDTPIAEMAIIGMGVGAAARGLRPVVDLMFMDFLGVAMDQVVNQAAKLRFMFGGEATVPMVLTTAYGAGLGAAAQHSQSLEAWLAHVPGLKVVMPATPRDVKGMIISSVRDNNPVVFMLHKRLWGSKGPVPEEFYEVPIGSAATHREGTDVTVVALGRMVIEALAAADRLAAEGISIEVVDPRTVQPLDTDTIVTSVRRTNHALVVHEAVTFGGIGAEIAAQIQLDAFDYLDAPVARIGAPFTPVPFSPSLESAYVPDAERIAQVCRDLLQRG